MSETEQPERKSKSQIKREMHALQDLGRELTRLPDKLFQQLPMTDGLREAIVAARHFKREALRRQLQHIGSIMRYEDVDAIQDSLNTLQRPQRAAVQAFHEVEQWRDALITGDTEILDELCGRYQQLDRQHVMQLVRNAGNERVQNKPPRSARNLFKYLSELREAE